MANVKELIKAHNDVFSEKTDEVSLLKQKLASKSYLLGLIEMEAIIETEREARAKYQKYLLELGYKISPEGVPEMVPNGQAEVVYTELINLKKNYEILKDSHRKVVEAGKQGTELVYTELTNLKKHYEILKESHRKVVETGKQGMDLVNLLEKRINSLGYDAVNVDAFGVPMRLTSARRRT
jgi:hypothetical protein